MGKASDRLDSLLDVVIFWDRFGGRDGRDNFADVISHKLIKKQSKTPEIAEV